VGPNVTTPRGYVLDGFGGVHQFGTAPALANYAYFPRQSVARTLTGY